ncbi:MAG: LPD1 domain-containing protein [Salinisphaeraceae bacterium]
MALNVSGLRALDDEDSGRAASPSTRLDVGGLTPLDTTGLQPVREARSTDRTWGEAITDVGAAFGSGAGGLLELGGTLYGLTTGDMDNLARRQGERTREFYQQMQSEGLQERRAIQQEAIENADGELGQFLTMLRTTASDPALMSTFMAEQVPNLVSAGAGGQVARAGAALLGAGAKGAGRAATAGAVGTGAAMQGADAGGQAFDRLSEIPTAEEQKAIADGFFDGEAPPELDGQDLWAGNAAYQKLIDEGVSPDAAREQVSLELSRMAFLKSAAFSAGVNLLIPGARSVERVLGGGAKAGSGGVGGALKGGAKGFLGEGAAEGADEAMGIYAANRAVGEVDTSQSATEGVGRAAAEGALFAPFGAVTGATEGARRSPDRPGLTPPDSGNTPDGVPPGSVRGDTLLGEEAQPEGVREKARSQTPPPSPGDVQSPIPTDLIAEGRATLQDADAEVSAVQMLEEAGLPGVGERVQVRDNGGNLVTGTIEDAFDDGGRRGAKVLLDDGRTLAEPFESLQGRVAPAAPLQPQDSTADEQQPRETAGSRGTETAREALDKLYRREELADTDRRALIDTGFATEREDGGISLTELGADVFRGRQAREGGSADSDPISINPQAIREDAAAQQRDGGTLDVSGLTEATEPGEYESRFQSRVERIGQARSREEVDAIWAEEEADTERYFEGSNRVDAAAQARKQTLDRADQGPKENPAVAPMLEQGWENVGRAGLQVERMGSAQAEVSRLEQDNPGFEYQTVQTGPDGDSQWTVMRRPRGGQATEPANVAAPERITRGMREDMADLGYSRAEIDATEPTEAQRIIIGQQRKPGTSTADKQRERMRKMREVNPDTDDVVTAIRKLGGIDTDRESDWRGRLNQLNANDRRVGLPGIERPGKGRTLDEIAERLAELGYIGTPENAYDQSEVADLLSRAETGEPVFGRAASGEQEAARRMENLADAPIDYDAPAAASVAEDELGRPIPPDPEPDAEPIGSGAAFEETAYEEDWDADTRIMEEWLQEAKRYDPEAADDILTSGQEDDVVVRRLSEIANEGRRREQQQAQPEGPRGQGTGPGNPQPDGRLRAQAPAQDEAPLGTAGPATPPAGEPRVSVEDYSDETIIVRDLTGENVERIKAALPNRKAIRNAKAGGWTFPKKREAEVRQALADLAEPGSGAATPGVGTQSDREFIAKGVAPMAQREFNAQRSFMDAAMEQFGLTDDEAGRAFQTLRKQKLVKVDPVNGQFTLKDGRFWDGEVMRRAAEQTPAEDRQQPLPPPPEEPDDLTVEDGAEPAASPPGPSTDLFGNPTRAASVSQAGTTQGPQQPVTDLFGEDTRSAQGIADEARRRDERRSSGADVPADLGGGLFSQATRQRDIEDAPAAEPGRIDDLGEKIGGARKDTASATGPRRAREASQDGDDRPGWAKRYVAMQSVKEDGVWTLADTRRKSRFGVRPATRKTFASEEEALAAIPLVEAGRNHRVAPSRKDPSKFAIWRDVTDRKRVQVSDGFETRDEAMAYMANNPVEIIETRTSFGEEILAKPDTVQRTGKAYREGDVVGEDFRDNFGFRGVEFGNWNNQAERQEVMNYAYDGLMDLADLIGVPPAALSMNGELALAFGARGHGLQGARAHYERNYGVINLTKMSGAGSLAHEWFHAMDHYLARQDGRANPRREDAAEGEPIYQAKDVSRDFQSGGRSRQSNLRDEVKQAYEQLIITMRRRAEEYVEDTQRAEGFVSSARDDLASSLQRIRDNLANEVRYKKRMNKPASAEMLAEFDRHAENLIEGRDLATEVRSFDEGRARSAMSTANMRVTNDSLEGISAVLKKVRGYSGFKAKGEGVLDEVRYRMSVYLQRGEKLDEARNEDVQTRNVPTDFASESLSIDQGRRENYWSTPHEMAARAFSAYVEDRIDERGDSSVFLSYGSDNRFYRLEDIRPFPEGDERGAINQAFDAFFETLQTRETDAGTEMFALPRRRDTTPVGERLATIEGMPSLTLPRNDVNRDAAEKAYRETESITLPDGSRVDVVNSSLGKLTRHRDRERLFQVMPELGRIAEASTWAYTEQNRNPRTASSVDAFHNYVSKVSIDGRDYYVRLTVKEARREQQQLHNVALSQVGVSRADAGGQPLSDVSKPTSADADASRDQKLLDWMDRVKARNMRQRMRDDIQVTPTEGFARQAEDVAADLQARLSQLGISDKVAVAMRERIQAVADGTASEADGRYLAGLIEVSMTAPDAMATMNHEAIHALRDMGLFRDAEWRTLEKAARADKARFSQVRRRYRRMGLSETQLTEETVAEMYSDWATGQTGRRGFIRAAFERVRNVLRAVGRVLTGRGFRTADSVFSRVERGDVGRRAGPPPRDASGRFVPTEAARYSARDGSEGQTRSDEFKRWFGDWEVSVVNQNLRDVTGSDLAKRAAEGFLNQPLRNTESGIEATVSRASLDKMLSKSSRERSVSTQAHMQAVANLDRLFPIALHRAQRPDREGSADIDAIHHFDAPMRFGDEVVRVKMMAKAFENPDKGTRLYLVQAVEIDAGVVGEEPGLPGQFRRGDAASSPPPSAENKRFAQMVAAVKGDGVSKVVDESGRPRVVFHGTASRFDAFRGPTWFTDDRAAAQGYAEQAAFGNGGEATVEPVYLDIRNPATPEDFARLGFDEDAIIQGDSDAQGLIDALEREGFDGATFTDQHPANGELIDAWVAFRPEQTKSATDNDGNFDRSNPGFRYSIRDPGPDFPLNDDQANDPTAEGGADARQKAAGQWFGSQPLDQAMRLPFHLAGGINERGEWNWGKNLSERAEQVITRASFREDGRFAWVNPYMERARAGLIDRYGLDPEYVERERVRGLDERRIMAEVPDILQKLERADIGPEESRVLQAVLTGEAVADADMAALAEPIRNAIDDMGAEAVQLGLLSAEAFDRNRGAYLQRVYLKHETDQGGLQRYVARMAGRQRKKIIGNQFKGRGLWIEVDNGRLMQRIPGFREGQRGGPVAGERVRVLDKVIDESNERLSGIDPAERRKVLDRVFLPEDAPIPDAISGYRDSGVWEVRATKGGKATLWRDFTKAEREQMGEIVDARYTIAKTYMGMAHDLSTGRFYADIAKNQDWSTGSEPPADRWKDANEYNRFWASEEIEWVKVPDTVIPKSRTKRYGALAGRYVRAEIWRDLHELEAMQKGGVWHSILTSWKLNKTARSPVVHMNNVVSNFLLMDLADVRTTDLVRGIRSMLKQDGEYQNAVENGAFGSDMMSQEIRNNVLEPILEDLQKEIQGGQGTVEARFGLLGKLADGIWSKGRSLDRKMVDLYQAEDEVFRMATYMRKRSQGMAPREAALEARDQFLNYDIRAPWVNAARRSVLPFISYTYRAMPVVAKSVALRPWKLAKYMSVAYAVNALGYALAPGDEDEERRSLRSYEQGDTWIGAPRMIRMPYADEYGNPVFLDVRRWVPAGDVFDMNQGHGAVAMPAWLQFGGPMLLGAELMLNKQAFTGREIVNHEADDWWDKTGTIADWAWKSWMPSAAWIPGSWYFSKLGDAMTGARDYQGRPYDLGSAALSSVGVKLKPQDVDEGFFWKGVEFDRVERELKARMSRIGRDYNRGLISRDAHQKRQQRVIKKLSNLNEKRRETFNGK